MVKDAHEICEGLFLGSVVSGKDLKGITEAGITAVLIAACDIEPHYPAELRYLVLPRLFDSRLQDILSYFEECFAFIDSVRNSGSAVLVHCMAGVSRSASIVIGYLMRTLDMSFSDALTKTKNIRPWIDPNDGFIRQLQLFDAMGRSCSFTPIMVTSDKDNEKRAEENVPGDEEQEEDDQQRRRLKEAYLKYQSWKKVTIRQRRMYEAAQRFSRSARIEASFFARFPASLSSSSSAASSASSTSSLSSSAYAASSAETTSERVYRCNTCKHPLYTEEHLIPHSPSSSTTSCNVEFIQAIEWMLHHPPRQERSEKEQTENTKEEQVSSPTNKGEKECSKAKHRTTSNNNNGIDNEKQTKNNDRSSDNVTYLCKDDDGEGEVSPTSKWLGVKDLTPLARMSGSLLCPCCKEVGYWNWLGNGCYCGERIEPAFLIRKDRCCSPPSLTKQA
ncbi:tyrosine protein phosphatase yvh1 [Balamuthia mandrillaris]